MPQARFGLNNWHILLVENRVRNIFLFWTESLNQVQPTIDSQTFATQHGTSSWEASSDELNEATKDKDNKCDDMVKVLRDMFPGKQYSELASIASESPTLTQAINSLLDNHNIIENEGNMQNHSE